MYLHFHTQHLDSPTISGNVKKSLDGHTNKHFNRLSLEKKLDKSYKQVSLHACIYKCWISMTTSSSWIVQTYTTTYPELLTDDISLGQNLSQCSGTKDITQSALRDSESGVLGILSLEDGGYGVCYPEVDHSIDLGSHTVLSQDLYKEERSTRSIEPSRHINSR